MSVTAASFLAACNIYLKLDEAAGQVKHDSTTNANHFTEGGTGALSASGKLGNAFKSDDAAAYLYAAHSATINPTTKLGICLWFKTSANSVCLLSRTNVANTNGFSMVIGSEGEPEITLGTGNSYASLTLNDNAWHQLAINYDGTQSGNDNRYQLWLDGVLKTSAYSASIPSTLTSITNSMFLGVLDVANSKSNYYAGQIDEVAISLTGFTPEQISWHYDRIAAGLSPIGNDVVTEVLLQNFDVAAGEVRTLTVDFPANDDGDTPDYTGQELVLRVYDHNEVLMFEIDGFASGSDVTFVTSAENTTSDLDAQTGPDRAAACDRTSLPCSVIHVNGSDETKLTEGILNVGRAA